MELNLKRFFLGVPAVVLLYVPFLLIWLEYKDIPFLSLTWWRYAFAFFFFWGGIILAGWAYYLLVSQGKGRPLMQIPTTKLVKTGPYAYIRNPVCVGAVSVLLGEALYFGSFYVFLWTVLVGVALYFYIVRVEEYRLANKFGQEYINYKMDVGMLWPRWRILRRRR